MPPERGETQATPITQAAQGSDQPVLPPVPIVDGGATRRRGRLLVAFIVLVAFFAVAACGIGAWLVAFHAAEREVGDPGNVVDGSQQAAAGGQPETERGSSGDGDLATGGAAEDAVTPASDQPLRGGVLRLPGANPTTLDPALVRDIVSADYMYEVYSGLVTLSPELEVVPDLAESWEVSSSGTVYTFTLHSGATFHSSAPVVAEDVRYSLERACDPATGSDVAGAYLDDIIGCSAMLTGKASQMSGVRVLGADKIAIEIDAPKAYFLAKLTYPTAFVVDRLQVEADPSWHDRPNGTGPFSIAQYEADKLMRLERHDGYHGAVAWLDAVEFDLGPFNAITRYENGEIDATPVGSFDLDRVSDPLNPLSSEVLEGPGDLGLTYIGFDVTSPPFDDVHLRRAFNLSVDKVRVAEIALRGAVEPMGTILPPGMPGHDASRDPWGYDPERARAELQRSRYGGPENMPPLVLHASGGAGGSPSVQAVVDVIEETLQVSIEIEQASWPLFQREVGEGVYRGWFLGWSADYPDPQDFLDVLFHSDSPLNATGYSDLEVDALLEAARIEQDEHARLEIYGRAESLILDAAPWVPLYTGVETWLVDPRVRGFILPPVVVPRLAKVWIADSD